MSKSVYEMVTERIIEELEKGCVPWHKPWTGTPDGAYNRITKKPYSLLNQMLLGKSGEWASFKQWSDLGGHVKKGEKASIAVFWKINLYQEQNEDGEMITKNVPLLRYYNVFHISQVEGVEPLPVEEREPVQPIESAEKLFQDYIKREKIQLEQTASNEAYYSPTRDLIHLPLMEQFVQIEEYYSTAFHEATHSTMSATRCNRAEDRKGKVTFGSEEYSKEELVAEIGSASILNLLGIETPKSFSNSTAYIKSWIEVLRNDVTFIVSASSKAEKAVQYIMAE